MFTGIINHLGTVVEFKQDKTGATMARIEVPVALLEQAQIGDSIAVNGCCLTLAEKDTKLASFNLSPETISRTVPLEIGAAVHLEESLRLGDKLGGHLVFGHVDGIATVSSIEQQAKDALITFEALAGCETLIVTKGSVTLAGVSLTVASWKQPKFSVQLVPHTLQVTTFSDLKLGDKLNFEVDMLARYVAANLQSY